MLNIAVNYKLIS